MNQLLVALVALSFSLGSMAVANTHANVQLLKASIRCDINGVKGSLGNGADPNFSDAEYTPLMAGANNGCVQVVDTLLKAGAEVNAFKNGVCGYNAIWLAAYGGNTSVVKLLASKHADYNAKGGCYSESSLQIAERYDRTNTAAYLRSLGAR